MRRLKLLEACGLAAAALSILALPASAAAPPPEPESPGCGGRIVAEFSHNSGEFGASGNPKSSSGPGFSLKQGTSGAVHEVKEVFCP